MKTTLSPSIETIPLIGVKTVVRVKESPSTSVSFNSKVDFEIVRISSSSTDAVSGLATGESLVSATVINTVAVLLSATPSLAL